MDSSILLNIGLMYAILIGVNLPAPFLGITFENDGSRQRLWYEPPGYVIPLAWFILFAMLGIARYELLRGTESGGAHWYLVCLAVVCATYAYYTIGLSRLTGLSALWYGLVGNAIVILIALIVAYLVGVTSMTAALLTLPVALWTLYATAIVIGEMRVQGLL